MKNFWISGLCAILAWLGLFRNDWLAHIDSITLSQIASRIKPIDLVILVVAGFLFSLAFDILDAATARLKRK